MVAAFERILMPTDFSPTSQHALEHAVAVALKFGASLHILHVIANPMEVAAWPEGYWVELSGLRQRLREDAEASLARLAKSIEGVRVTTEVLDGVPARAIVGAAKKHGAQLIVMGTHGHGGVTHLLLGSVAERVVRTAPCPVLTVSAASAEAAPGAATSG
jgi:nucleotide-binding universal stress UspA family protein